jgi:alpha-beta hydrolase superfamily lysophospholipase
MSKLLDTPLPGFGCIAPDSKAALLIVHGLAEYADRYREAADELSARGISSFAFDQRGHGKAPGVRTHVDRFDRFVDDLGIASRAVRERFPKLPLFIWGHSMGSIVVLASAAAGSCTARGVITTSNSLEVFRRGPNPTSALFRAAARILPRVRIPLGLDATKISTDPAVQRAYAGDPQIPGTASLRLIVEFALACERCRESAARITLPWLVVHGEADAIAPAAGSRVLMQQLGSRDKQLAIYPGLRHEVHNEAGAARAEFLDLISRWIVERV